MNGHFEREFLSAYIDNELGSGDRLKTEDHLIACAECRDEMLALGRAKTMTGSLGRKKMPQSLVKAMEKEASRRLMRGWWKELVHLPRVWVPAAGFAVAVLAFGLWFLQKPAPEDGIPVDALLAAHDRYLDEGSLPPADLTSGSFSAKLASFRESE